VHLNKAWMLKCLCKFDQEKQYYNTLENTIINEKEQSFQHEAETNVLWVLSLRKHL